MHLFLLFLEKFSNPEGGPAGIMFVNWPGKWREVLYTAISPHDTVFDRVFCESRARWATNEARRIDRSVCRDLHTRELPLEDFISNREALSQSAPHEWMDSMVRRWIKSFGGSFQASRRTSSFWISEPGLRLHSVIVLKAQRCNDTCGPDGFLVFKTAPHQTQCV